MHIVLVQPNETDTADFIKLILDQLEFAREKYHGQSPETLLMTLRERAVALHLYETASVYGAAIDIAVLALRLACDTNLAATVSADLEAMFPDFDRLAMPFKIDTTALPENERRDLEEMLGRNLPIMKDDN